MLFSFKNFYQIIIQNDILAKLDNQLDFLSHSVAVMTLEISLKSVLLSGSFYHNFCLISHQLFIVYVSASSQHSRSHYIGVVPFEICVSEKKDKTFDRSVAIWTLNMSRATDILDRLCGFSQPQAGLAVASRWTV